MRSSLTCLLASALATIASLTACNDDDAVLSTSDSICKHVPAPAGAATSLCETTIADLLHISAGLRWHDSGASDGAGDDIPMLYGEGCRSSRGTIGS